MPPDSSTDSNTPQAMPIRTILVPQGAEYRAVQKGCQRVQAAVTIVPLPMGSAAGPSLEPWLKKYKRFANAGYLLVGLGGGLSPDLAPGDRVLCETTQAAAGEGDPIPFDGLLNEWIRQRLPGLKTGWAAGCDRIITTVSEKQTLHQTLGATVAEMESLSMLQVLQPQGKRLAMVRVISDGCCHDLPNIASAIHPNGSLRPLTLAGQFIQRPMGAGRLVTGSLRGLKQLEKLMAELFKVSSL